MEPLLLLIQNAWKDQLCSYKFSIQLKQLELKTEVNRSEICSILFEHLMLGSRPNLIFSEYMDYLLATEDLPRTAYYANVMKINSIENCQVILCVLNLLDKDLNRLKSKENTAIAEMSSTLFDMVKWLLFLLSKCLAQIMEERDDLSTSELIGRCCQTLLFVVDTFPLHLHLAYLRDQDAWNKIKHTTQCISVMMAQISAPRMLQGIKERVDGTLSNVAKIRNAPKLENSSPCELPVSPLLATGLCIIAINPMQSLKRFFGLVHSFVNVPLGQILTSSLHVCFSMAYSSAGRNDVANEARWLVMAYYKVPEAMKDLVEKAQPPGTGRTELIEHMKTVWQQHDAISLYEQMSRAGHFAAVLQAMAKSQLLREAEINKIFSVASPHKLQPQQTDSAMLQRIQNVKQALGGYQQSGDADPWLNASCNQDWELVAVVASQMANVGTLVQHIDSKMTAFPDPSWENEFLLLVLLATDPSCHGREHLRQCQSLHSIWVRRFICGEMCSWPSLAEQWNMTLTLDEFFASPGSALASQTFESMAGILSFITSQLVDAYRSEQATRDTVSQWFVNCTCMLSSTAQVLFAAFLNEHSIELSIEQRASLVDLFLGHMNAHPSVASFLCTKIFKRTAPADIVRLRECTLVAAGSWRHFENLEALVDIATRRGWSLVWNELWLNMIRSKDRSPEAFTSFFAIQLYDERAAKEWTTQIIAMLDSERTSLSTVPTLLKLIASGASFTLANWLNQTVSLKDESLALTPKRRRLEDTAESVEPQDLLGSVLENLNAQLSAASLSIESEFILAILEYLTNVSKENKQQLKRVIPKSMVRHLANMYPSRVDLNFLMSLTDFSVEWISSIR